MLPYFTKPREAEPGYREDQSPGRSFSCAGRTPRLMAAEFAERQDVSPPVHFCSEGIRHASGVSERIRLSPGSAAAFITRALGDEDIRSGPRVAVPGTLRIAECLRSIVQVTAGHGDSVRSRKTKTGAMLLAVAGLTAGCSDLGSEPVQSHLPSDGQISFSQQVLPILRQSGCTGCHGGNGGLFAGTVQQLLLGGIHGPAVVPGKGDSSLIIQKLSVQPPFGDRMPLGGPYLPEAPIAIIRTWIDQGAQDN